jgi:hypothetical protein
MVPPTGFEPVPSVLQTDAQSNYATVTFGAIDRNRTCIIDMASRRNNRYTTKAYSCFLLETAATSLSSRYISVYLVSVY